MRNLLLAAAGVSAFAGVARADTPGISVTTDQTLRFGSFVVPFTGSRTIDAGGAVASDGVFAAGNDPVGPAQFTITYDRGPGSTAPVTVIVQVLLAGAASQVQGGVSGGLSTFSTDLPGVTALLPGQAVTFSITNCRTQTCSQTFHVGGRLDVTRFSGGASLAIPLPVSATVLAVM
ncbi:MAG: DUF4402 domain-containing protein [Sphingomonadales bacterium]|nr:DUF4402 domain-containing protein [Sphingomonadales bacterium]